jgi:hypothetical protein
MSDLCQLRATNGVGGDHSCLVAKGLVIRETKPQVTWTRNGFKPANLSCPAALSVSDLKPSRLAGLKSFIWLQFVHALLKH